MTYKIFQTSPFHYIVTFLSVLFGSVAILIATKAAFPIGKMGFLIGFVPIFFAAFRATRYTAVAQIEITLDDTGFEKRWLTQFLFYRKKDRKISWTEVNDYVFQPDRQFDKFRVRLKKGPKFQFFHNNDHNQKDDFLLFVTDFEVKVEELKERHTTCNDIKRGKTIYETSGGLILAVISVILLIAIPVMLFLAPAGRTPNYGSIGASYIGLVYFVFQVYAHRKAANTDPNR